MSEFYESLPPMQDEAGEITLVASFTPNNGIRIGLQEGVDTDWLEFDFDPEQAETIGHALVRWAQRVRSRA